MRTLKHLLKKHYCIYYLLIALVLASLLGIEELLDGTYENLNDVLLEFLTDIPSFFLLSILISVIAYQVIQWLENRYIWEYDAIKRITAEGIILAILTAVFSTTASIIVSAVSNNEARTEGSKFEVLAMLMFLIGNAMIFIYHEYILFDIKKKKISLTAKELQKQNLLLNYEALKNQVNPHFLFNSLNVLTNLIKKDVELSEQYITGFSRVYRYVLEHNEKDFVSLKEELDFIESYIFLQRIRYGDNLIVSKKIDAEAFRCKIPPMALQITVENALKHNSISEDSPLHLHFYSTDDSIVLKNNYNLRKSRITSTGLGQKNLKERYKIMDSSIPKFYVEDDFYYSELPLIKPN